jgi:hypothetical protein
MARFDPARTAGRWVKAVKNGALTDRAKKGAATLKAEYEAGRRGDPRPVEPIWPTPAQQLDAVLGKLRSLRRKSPSPSVVPEPAPSAAELDAEAQEVATALGTVDWGQVKAETARRTGDAARAMKAMADQVDWAKVQPMAAQVSSALIAAVASGRLPVGGRLTSTVARAIVDQGGLAQRVGQNLDRLPPDFRQVIDTTASETPPD